MSLTFKTNYSRNNKKQIIEKMEKSNIIKMSENSFFLILSNVHDMFITIDILKYKTLQQGLGIFFKI